MSTKHIDISATGKRCGESHPKATLTDHEIDLLLELRAEGYSLAWLAEKFEVAKTTAHSIVTGRTRALIPATYRTPRAHVSQL